MKILLLVFCIVSFSLIAAEKSGESKDKKSKKEKVTSSKPTKVEHLRNWNILTEGVPGVRYGIDCGVLDRLTIGYRYMKEYYSKSYYSGNGIDLSYYPFTNRLETGVVFSAQLYRVNFIDNRTDEEIEFYSKQENEPRHSNGEYHYLSNLKVEGKGFIPWIGLNASLGLNYRLFGQGNSRVIPTFSFGLAF